ncbi:MAG: L-seryl-tRNA(Sec) selenium transferase, partial [Desulfovibrionales bacterium]
LRLYLDPDLAREQIPTLNMITASAEELASRARKLAAALRRKLGDEVTIRTFPGASRVGGGSLPERDLPTTLVGLIPTSDISLEKLRDRLLATDPPMVGRIEQDMFCLDPRTLLRDETPLVVHALKQALG